MLWLLPRLCTTSATAVCLGQQIPVRLEGSVSQPFQGQLADTPKSSMQGLTGEAGEEVHSFQLQQCNRRVHVEVSRWPAFWGLQCRRSARPCPSPYLTGRQSLSARVVPHPATWPLRKAVVLSKEGAQLSWRRLCFQFSVPLIFPGKAGLVKCLKAAFWENACSLKSLLDHSPNSPGY